MTAGPAAGAGTPASEGKAGPRRRARQLFFASWILFTAHFATNVEREHYPAFSLIDHGTLQVDEYLGFHSDIFQHTDGHAYVGNNVATSFFAAIPLALFDPVLDRLEARSRARLEAVGGSVEAEYRTYDHHPNRKAFFQLVSERGLELRFGGAAAVTTAFLMAPLSALMVAVLFLVLAARGMAVGRATLAAILFGFGTPIFFRTSALSHNMFVMYATFASFLILWLGKDGDGRLSWGRRALAGGLAGLALAFDYSGVVPLLALYGYLVADRWRTVGFVRSFRESLVFVAGSVPPVLLLLYTQWSMFGNPFLPGQYWMPAVNYTDRGWRGFSAPTADLFWLNLFEPEWGMYMFGPLLLLGLVPVVYIRNRDRVLPGFERWWLVAYLAAFMVFCAANQYSRMQFNTGFRYMLPLVPFIVLQLSDHLSRVPRVWLWVLGVPVLVHSWVITVYRESAALSWQLFLERGVDLPWLTVLRMTQPEGAPVVSSPLLPWALLLAAVGASALVWWWFGERGGSAGNVALA